MTAANLYILRSKNHPKHSASFFGYLRSEITKLRHSSIFIAHGATSLGVVGLFLFYYSFSVQDPLTKTAAFFEVLGCGMPFLIGLFCALSAEQEYTAGNFGNIGSVVSKRKALAAKLFVFLGLALGALLCASVLFAAGMITLGQNLFSLVMFLGIGFAIWLGSIASYLISFFVAFRFGKNVSIACGVFGSLLAALMLTGLGEGTWPFIPVAWPARFAVSIINFAPLNLGAVLSSMMESTTSDVGISLVISCAFTVIGGIVFLWWSGHFEGRANDE